MFDHDLRGCLKTQISHWAPTVPVQPLRERLPTFFLASPDVLPSSPRLGEEERLGGKVRELPPPSSPPRGEEGD